MVQKIGAQYLVKRVSDYVMAPPKTAAEPEAEQPRARDEAISGPDLDGEEIRDDDGQRLGTARRIRDIAVYVVADGYGDRVDLLHQCLDDPETKVLFHTVDGRLAGLIYVPDPSKAPPRTGGMRADEV